VSDKILRKRIRLYQETKNFLLSEIAKGCDRHKDLEIIDKKLKEYLRLLAKTDR